MRPTGLVPILVFVALLSAATSFAQKPGAAAAPAAPTNDDCLACHGDQSAAGASGRSVAVLPDKYGAAIHGLAGVACVNCHVDLATATEFPHAEKLAAASCAACHSAATALYEASVHAEAKRASAESVAAACKDCHGSHEIRPVKDPESPVYHLSLPATCGRCHGNADIIRRGRIAVGDVVAQFQDSIHGRALARSGLTVAPNCSDCHKAHDIRRSTDAASPVFRTAIAATCGNCHAGVQREYHASVHGSAVANGRPDAPACVDCHSAHQIQRTEGAPWKSHVLAECGSCHAESTRTFRDTFHGQETQLGYMRVATCADCHGAHAIYPKSDARSTVSAARLVATCRTCHPGAGESFARYDPHADRHSRARNPMLYYAAKFMEALLIGVFAFFGIHTVLWTSRSVRPELTLRPRPRAGRPPQE